MTKVEITLETALGAFQFSAECDAPAKAISLNLVVFEPRLHLSKGMSILSCRAVVLDVTARHEVGNLR